MLNTIYFLFGLLVAVFLFLAMYLLVQLDRKRAEKRENTMIKRLTDELEKRGLKK